jgi:hypothetical protein
MIKMKETLEKLNPKVIEKLNVFFSETFLVDSSEINYGHSTRFGILFEAMWGYYMKEELQVLGYMVKWICRNQYNDFYISDLVGNFICNIEVKTLCLDSDESKSHFDALQSELLDTDLLFVSAWKWDVHDDLMKPKITESKFFVSKEIAVMRDELHILRGGNFVNEEPINASGYRERLSGPDENKPPKVTHMANFGGLVRMLGTKSKPSKIKLQEYYDAGGTCKEYIDFVRYVKSS